MIDATEIRLGNILKVDGAICKVILQEMKGTGKFGKTVHLKLKSLSDGHLIEKAFRAEEKAEDVDIQHVKLQYLYKSGDVFAFMNNENYEEVTLPASVIGKQEVFLKENTEMNAIFSDGRALTIDFPKTVELKVTSAPPGQKGRDNSTYKEVELENGLKILAPQFVNVGETVKVDTEDFSYIDRVTVKSLKHEEG